MIDAWLYATDGASWQGPQLLPGEMRQAAFTN